MKKRLLVCSMIALALTLSGCGKRAQLPRGKMVTVQFRRDALGSAHTLPIPPTTDSQNGARVSLRGKLLGVNEEWVVLEHNKQKHWIPRDTILLIRVEK